MDAAEFYFQARNTHVLGVPQTSIRLGRRERCLLPPPVPRCMPCYWDWQVHPPLYLFSWYLLVEIYSQELCQAAVILGSPGVDPGKSLFSAQTQHVFYLYEASNGFASADSFRNFHQIMRKCFNTMAFGTFLNTLGSVIHTSFPSRPVAHFFALLYTHACGSLDDTAFSNSVFASSH